VPARLESCRHLHRRLFIWSIAPGDHSPQSKVSLATHMRLRNMFHFGRSNNKKPMLCLISLWAPLGAMQPHGTSQGLLLNSADLPLKMIYRSSRSHWCPWRPTKQVRYSTPTDSWTYRYLCQHDPSRRRTVTLIAMAVVPYHTGRIYRVPYCPWMKPPPGLPDRQVLDPKFCTCMPIRSFPTGFASRWRAWKWM
jgi:hypothetical protein